MGLAIGFNSFKNYTPPNPNPSIFKIIRRSCNGIREIVEVQYAGCTTFDGHKLLLLRGRLPPNLKTLDPHLLGDDHLVIARFEPNPQGWKLARLCSHSLDHEPR